MIRLESQHDLPFSREDVWPLLSNTDLLNRSLGLPPVRYEIIPETGGGSTTIARATMFGRKLKWREFPFEWLEPEFYRVRRLFENGPLLEATTGIELHEMPGGATRVFVSSELNPRGPFGKWLVRQILKPKIERGFRRIIDQSEAFLRGQARVRLPRLHVHPVNEAALQSGLSRLRILGQPAELVARLEQFLRESPDVELSHIRPLAVARSWNCDPWQVLGLFLRAPQCGLLDLRWEILCPNCRSSNQPAAASLAGLKRTSHCDVCRIEYDAEFDKSVELKFSINTAIRPLEEQTFCLFGPGGKPHIVSQYWLNPKEDRLCRLPRMAGQLRLRSPQVLRTKFVEPEELARADARAVITCCPDEFRIEREPGAGPGRQGETLREPAHEDAHRNAIARVINPNDFPVLLCLEKVAWSDDILTAARITNWQEFRELFATEVISPTERVTVGSQVVLFTDLRGSTALYRSLGDAPAYAVVRDHFAVLLKAVAGNHGSIVKTIGDAVMAVFSRVDEALAAVEQMHREIGKIGVDSSDPLLLKSSLHIGPCLAVNANDKLDFFGSSINLAARMVECCQGGDLAVSDEFYHHPEMVRYLETARTKPEASEVRFRGFESPVRVWRLNLADGPQRRTTRFF